MLLFALLMVAGLKRKKRKKIMYMKKFRADHYNLKIEELEIVKETEKQR